MITSLPHQLHSLQLFGVSAQRQHQLQKGSCLTSIQAPAALRGSQAGIAPRVIAFASNTLPSLSLRSPPFKLDLETLNEYRSLQYQLNSVYFILCLLEAHGFFQPATVAEQAFERVEEFLGERSRPGDTDSHVDLDKGLQTVQDQFQLKGFKSLSPKDAITEMFGHTVLDDLEFPVSFMLQSDQRFDKRWTGLPQTIIRDDATAQMIELCKTFCITKALNTSLMMSAQALVQDPVRCQHVTTQSLSPEDVAARVVLGRGGQSHAVVMGRRVIDGELVAVKKIKERRQERVSDIEMQSALAIRNHLKGSDPTEIARHFLLPEFVVHGQGADKMEKSYVVMPLDVSGDLSDEMRVLSQHFERGSSAWQDAHWETIERVIRLVDYLESNNIAHPDLKPENVIGGRLVDLGGVWLGDVGRLRVHTKSFAPPEALLKSTFKGAETQAYDRFSLGVILVQSLEGSLPHDLPEEHPLFLSALSQGSVRDGLHERGYTDLKAPLHDSPSGRSLTHYERAVIIAAKGFAQHLPEQRVSPRKILGALSVIAKRDIYT